MELKLSTWGGFPVYGDACEIDAIITSEALINLDKGDVDRVLSAEGDNYVITGTGATIADAFGNAVKNMPFHAEKLSTVLIQFRYGDSEPLMSDMVKIKDLIEGLGESVDIVWGMANDPGLGDDSKAVIIASVKA